jgi:hypothetical protein
MSLPLTNPPENSAKFVRSSCVSQFKPTASYRRDFDKWSEISELTDSCRNKTLLRRHSRSSKALRCSRKIKYRTRQLQKE